MLKQTQKNQNRVFRLRLRARLRLLKKSIFGSSAPVSSSESEPKRKTVAAVSKRSARQISRNPKTEEAPSSRGRRPEPRSVKGERPPAAKRPDVRPKKVRTALPPMPEIVPPPKEEGKTRFTDLPIAREVLAGIQALSFHYCTPIQEQCLPVALEGRDLTGKAQTGTGKTAAFLASSMTRLLLHPLDPAQRKNGSCRMLVLSPTRELAIQIYNDALVLGKFTGLNNLVIFGGMDHQGQRNSLAEPIDILVGTPGRIIDYSRSGHLDLSAVEILVIDEADRMLDMGFIPDVRRIVAKLPPAGKRQTMLFSATLEPEVLRLVDRWLVNPASFEAEKEHVVTELIDQRFYAVMRHQKLAFLLWLLRNEPFERMIIFGNWKERNAELVERLYEYGVQAELLSGDIPQAKRLNILERFKSGEIKVVVATDVAARGIHIAGISHVINYDLPDHAEDYVHRIGRTGRAGVTGKSISFVCEYGAYVMPQIEEYAHIKIKTVLPEDEMLVLPEKVNPVRKRAPRSGSSSGRRGNRPYPRRSGGSSSRPGSR
ncbi:MAG: ATP-dependent RNA helicase RhlB [Lentisphaerae bacterium ADurb.Bin242]|nr:MAG: ATP-dependent RNA helicase RhlB [Lentisphaerae bacterium ADurb.Bin242]